ncbi:hypothetical protein WME75_29035 [Sorangium sp. So ce1014]|uniref:RCC1 domain-containing protein n=1 Tax=Sorangium sp. So ce1014 TaxID=3133326 RepID=UPI003F62262F
MASTHRPRASRIPSASLLLAAAYVPAAVAVAVACGACGKEFTARPPDLSTSSSTGGGSGGGGSGGSGGSGGACPGGGEVCGDTCVDTTTDAEHCGACDVVCSAFGGRPSCLDGVCQSPACEENRGSCDKDPENGCEVDLLTSLSHCGSCDNPCSGQCVQGACVVPRHISAGTDYTCAVLSDSTVWCWGRNTWGNIGDGTLQQDRPIPRQVIGLGGGAVKVATSISSARSHTCAVLTDGAVACWGAGNSGQLGDGQATNALSPVRARDLAGATQVAAGGSHTCAVTASHGLFCWGEGSSGQLGYGDEADQYVPTVVLDGVDSVSAGLSHTCAGMIERMGERLMSCWGHNLSGQLGAGSFQPSSVPLTLPGLTSVALTAAGALHTCAAPATGVASCWGEGAQYRLGTGTENVEAAPREIPDLVDVSRLALGARHSGAVLASGDVLLWGDNTKGQLGNGTQDPLLLPQPLELTDVVELALGSDHSCALRRTGEMLCWGDNRNGELGDGTVEPRLAPTPVAWPARP